MGDTEFGSWGSNELGGYIRREEARKDFMDKSRKAVLDKLDRIVLFLTLERIDSRTQREWEVYNEAAMIVRNARKEVAHGNRSGGTSSDSTVAHLSPAP